MTTSAAMWTDAFMKHNWVAPRTHRPTEAVAHMRASGACGTIIAPETPRTAGVMGEEIPKNGGPGWDTVVDAARTSSPCDGSGARATACATGRRRRWCPPSRLGLKGPDLKEGALTAAAGSSRPPEHLARLRCRVWNV